MRNSRIVMALIALLAVAGATAAYAITYYSTPELAVENDTRVINKQNRLDRDGCTLTDVNGQNYYYFVQPENPYVWGTITYIYNCPCQPVGQNDICTGTDIVELTAEVSYDDPGFFVSKVTTTETTVY